MTAGHSEAAVGGARDSTAGVGREESAEALKMGHSAPVIGQRERPPDDKAAQERCCQDNFYFGNAHSIRPGPKSACSSVSRKRVAVLWLERPSSALTCSLVFPSLRCLRP